MSFGLKQLRLTGPSESNFIAKKCKKRVRIFYGWRWFASIISSLRVGFQYNTGAMTKPQNAKKDVDNAWGSWPGPIRGADSDHNFLQYVPSNGPGCKISTH